jgi:hypothetical protein
MSSLKELAAKRFLLGEAVRMMTDAQRDMRRYQSEASLYCGYAAAWAAVLMTVEIVKIGLTASDSKAAAAFSVIDRSIDQANKLLIAFGHTPIQKKEQALESLDPSLRKVSAMTQTIQQARGVLKKLGVTEQKELALLLDLGVAMTDDTLLMLQAGLLDQKLFRSSQAAITRTGHQIELLKSKINRLDDQIQYLLYQRERFVSTA